MPEDSPESLIAHLTAFRDSGRPAVQTGSVTLSYADLVGLIEQTAAHLRGAGVAPGDRILVQLPNGAEHVIGVLATIAIGAIAVPVDNDAGEGRLSDVVRQTAPRFCLAQADRAEQADISTIRLRIDPGTRTAHCAVQASTVARSKPFAHPGNLAFIRFTSGSTGLAKGVGITHAQQLWTARTLSECLGLDAGHRELILVSMALSGGWQRVAATLYGGGCVIVGQKPLSVGDLLDELVSNSATGFFTPPPLVRMLLASPADGVGAALQGCRTIEIGSAAIAAEELRALIRLAPDAGVYVHYGLTECSRAVILDTAQHPDRLGTVGRPAPGVELMIVDEQGHALPCDRTGQILLRGPQLSSGYWRQPELNRQRFADGWLATGDYGFLDEAGFLTLRGRHDDLINCGGHCYFPNEVEQALGKTSGVEQYLVAGVPDPRGVLQDVPWAFVVPDDADDWSPTTFLKHARAKLPAHMVPRQVIAVARLPLTASGKPDRRETVRIYASATWTETQ